MIFFVFLLACSIIIHSTHEQKRNYDDPDTELVKNCYLICKCNISDVGTTLIAKPRTFKNKDSDEFHVRSTRPDNKAMDALYKILRSDEFRPRFVFLQRPTVLNEVVRRPDILSEKYGD